MTKLWKYLKNMAKSGRKALLVSLVLICFLSCAIPPSTYSRQDIDKSIKEICKQEFNINVGAWLIEDTVWVYAPVKKIFNDKKQWEEESLESIRATFLALSRVLLSMDNPPSFFVFVISDIETIGVDLYYIGFIPDMLKMQKMFISIGQWQEREVVINFPNPKALGDQEGSHFQKHNIIMGEFISYLLNQDMQRLFVSPSMKDSFQINDLRVSHRQNTLNIFFDILDKQNNRGRDFAFDEIKKNVKKLLKIYADCGEIKEIEINDIANNKIRRYSIKELLSDKEK